MIRDRALTLEALRVMDEIDRRGSFAAAADALGRVPSALSYTIQKLEEDLDVILFDRSGHRTKFTPAGRMLLEQGRLLLSAAEKLTHDTVTLAKGWETHITIVCEVLVPARSLFPLVTRLAEKSDTQVSIFTEVLSGAWERLELGQADILLAPQLHFRESSEINSRKLYRERSFYVASSDHPIHQEADPLSEESRIKYRGIAVADTAKERPLITVQLLDRQPRLTVSTLEDKKKALLDGLGVATMPLYMIQNELDAGKLRIIGDSESNDSDILMVWRRDSIGEAKAWFLREIPKLFKTFYQ
jgi:DNA-binding transcriptional LysR family regulator